MFRAYYDYAALFEILTHKNTVIAERNCIPYLLQEVATEEYYVIQPDGTCHQTHPDLHEFHGTWMGKKFNNQNFNSVLIAARVSGATVTDEEKIGPAISKLGRGYSQIGWCPSISHIRGFVLPEEIQGATIIQPWGEQQLTPKLKYLAAVCGSRPDCYAEEESNFRLWRDVDDITITGQDLTDRFQQLTLAELESAKVREPKADIAAARH